MKSYCAIATAALMATSAAAAVPRRMRIEKVVHSSAASNKRLLQKGEPDIHNEAVPENGSLSVPITNLPMSMLMPEGGDTAAPTPSPVEVETVSPTFAPVTEIPTLNPTRVTEAPVAAMEMSFSMPPGEDLLAGSPTNSPVMEEDEEYDPLLGMGSISLSMSMPDEGVITPSPTVTPTPQPTRSPLAEGETASPTAPPTTEAPTLSPTPQPTRSPLEEGETHEPTESPTSVPSFAPTTAAPTVFSTDFVPPPEPDRSVTDPSGSTSLGVSAVTFIAIAIGTMVVA
mmetsp:Transcript_25425/g.52462  ORF Transcript_25425/g.52462 Transcript_25425/m.52462 type:complete len:285 (-) Transcript_25425:309-1163(-)